LGCIDDTATDLFVGDSASGDRCGSIGLFSGAISVATGGDAVDSSVGTATVSEFGLMSDRNPDAEILTGNRAIAAFTHDCNRERDRRLGAEILPLL